MTNASKSLLRADLAEFFQEFFPAWECQAPVIAEAG